MGDRVRKIILFKFNQYKDLEVKLEAMAEEGLFLEKVGTFWTFRKDEPKKLKYAVTYFSEASIFNPEATDNQQTYWEYAEEAGWQHVAEINQMQIFCNEDDNPIPFETDEREKFENIKKCMGKNYVPSTIFMILIFMLNLMLQLSSCARNPVDFLAQTSSLIPIAMLVPTIIYFVYMLIGYGIWCKQCEKSLSMGDGCIEKLHRYQSTIDFMIIFYNLILITLSLGSMFNHSNIALILLVIIQFPILTCIFRFSISYFKHKKCSAMFNRIVSGTLLMVASFAYIVFVGLMIIKFDLFEGKEKEYRVIEWQVTPYKTREYKIYTDDIPLKCEDLYEGVIDENYSYKKDVDESIFLTRNKYGQYALPERDASPEIEYVIAEPKFEFVYDMVIEDFKEIPEWSDKKIEEMDNLIFGTEAAYQFYYDDKAYNGEYILAYKDRIIWLKVEEPLKEEQIYIVKEKLVGE